MKYSYTALIVLFFTLTSMTCYKESANCHNTITVQNNTSNAIYYYVSRDSNLSSITNPHFDAGDYKCEAMASHSWFLGSCWETYIKSTPELRMYPFVFDAYTIEHTPWDTIRARGLYLKRYNFSTADFQANNWRITFP